MAGCAVLCNRQQACFCFICRTTGVTSVRVSMWHVSRPSSSGCGKKIGQGKMFNVCYPQERGKEHLQLEIQPTHSILMWHDRMSQLEREWPCRWVMKWKENTRGFIQSNLFKHSVVTINVVIWDVLSPTCIHFKFALYKEFLFVFSTLWYVMFTVHCMIRCGIFLAHSQEKKLLLFEKLTSELIFLRQAKSTRAWWP